MSEQYDSRVAAHYAAFRPRLHGMILGRMLRCSERFQSGLDLGCGTGWSAVALAEHCDSVVGLDNSPAMLDRALPHPRITYVRSAADALAGLAGRPFEVVSFAGSLSYIRTERLRQELRAACGPDAAVLVYDFEVLLDEVMVRVGARWSRQASSYDYHANLSGWSEFEVVTLGVEQIPLELSGTELAHLLLSDSNRYEALLAVFSNAHVFDSLTDALGECEGEGNGQVQARTYFTRYCVRGGAHSGCR